MTQPRKPKGAPNSAGGQYDTYAHTTPTGLPALDGELAWERERGEGGRVEQSQQPAPPVGVADGGYGQGRILVVVATPSRVGGCNDGIRVRGRAVREASRYAGGPAPGTCSCLRKD